MRKRREGRKGGEYISFTLCARVAGAGWERGYRDSVPEERKMLLVQVRVKAKVRRE